MSRPSLSGSAPACWPPFHTCGSPGAGRPPPSIVDGRNTTHSHVFFIQEKNAFIRHHTSQLSVINEWLGVVAPSSVVEGLQALKELLLARNLIVLRRPELHALCRVVVDVCRVM
jgi:hypothetical protein